MPGLNGFQATRAITREDKTKHIPVIICTTKDQETDKIWGLRQGAKDYVTKPHQRERPSREDQGAGITHGAAHRPSRIPALGCGAHPHGGLAHGAFVEARLPGRRRELVRRAAPGERGDPRARRRCGVPLTQSWFRGVSNMRGNLYSVIDFLPPSRAARPTAAGVERRVILISDRLVAGAGLLVSRMLGLRSPEQFTAAPRPRRRARPGLRAVYTDAGARAGSSSICPRSFESSGSWKSARRRQGHGESTSSETQVLDRRLLQAPWRRRRIQAQGRGAPRHAIGVVVDDDQHQGGERHGHGVPPAAAQGREG